MSLNIVMTYNFIKWASLLENDSDQLSLNKLPYSPSDLDPAISEDTIHYHYDKLAKGYVDRFNKGEGDANFNRAGAFLHNILFPQYQLYKSNNAPSGAILEFIEKNHGTFSEFKDKFAKVAMGIQGSGWVYLSHNGDIKTIKNHQIKSDIILLIDWWEHSWVLDYQADKAKYLTNQWKIINWNLINDRLGIMK
jgi:Fe-Mn family superoxide dismutase